MRNQKTWLSISIFAVLALLLVACGQTPSASTAETMGEPIASEAIKELPTETQNGLVWVANGMEDSLSLVDPTTSRVVSEVSTGMNPHILDISPDGQIIYVINAGEHDREPGAHGDASVAATETNADHHGDNGKMESAKAADYDGNMAGDSEISPTANSLWAIDAVTTEVLARVPVGAGPTHPIPSSD